MCTWLSLIGPSHPLDSFFSAQLTYVTLPSSPFSYKYPPCVSFFSQTEEATGEALSLSSSPSSSLSSIALKMFRGVVSTGLIALIKRRTYSTAAITRKESRARTADSSSPVSSTSTKSSSASSSSWVPDPVTGYYRPGDRRAEIDAAEMRESLLSHHKTQD